MNSDRRGMNSRARLGNGNMRYALVEVRYAVHARRLTHTTS